MHAKGRRKTDSAIARGWVGVVDGRSAVVAPRPPLTAFRQRTRVGSVEKDPQKEKADTERERQREAVLHDLQKEVMRLGEVHLGLEEELARLRKEVSILLEMNKAKDEELCDKETSIEELKREVKKSQGALMEAQGQRASLVNEVCELRQHVAGMEQELGARVLACEEVEHRSMRVIELFKKDVEALRASMQAERVAHMQQHSRCTTENTHLQRLSGSLSTVLHPNLRLAAPESPTTLSYLTEHHIASLGTLDNVFALVPLEPLTSVFASSSMSLPAHVHGGTLGTVLRKLIGTS